MSYCVRSLSLLAIFFVFTVGAADPTPPPQPNPTPPEFDDLGYSYVIVGFLTFFFFCYLVQGAYAFVAASRRTLPNPHGNLLRKVFFGDGQRDTWVFVIITFLLSIGITLIAQLLQLTGGNMPARLIVSDILYHLSVQNLLVLITLEVSYLHEAFRKGNNRWTGLMLAALVIDLLAYMLLSGIKEPADRDSKLQPGLLTATFLAITFALSFISSAGVILFNREDEAHLPQLGLREREITVLTQ